MTETNLTQEVEVSKEQIKCQQLSNLIQTLPLTFFAFNTLSQFLPEEPHLPSSWLHNANAALRIEKPFFAAIKWLIENGHPLHALDQENKTAACIIRERGLKEQDLEALCKEIWEYMVEEMVRREMIFNSMSEGVEEDEEYLNRKVEYKNNDLLVDSDRNAVMMSWESPLMLQHAKLITQTEDSFECQDPSKIWQRNEWMSQVSPTTNMISDDMPVKTVLNVGYGMGIIDHYITACLLHQSSISLHVIIEAHPAVLQKMSENQWTTFYNGNHIENPDDLPEFSQILEMITNQETKGPFLVTLNGKWQEWVPAMLEKGWQMTGIFFDTFGEYYKELALFQTYLEGLLFEQIPSYCTTTKEFIFSEENNNELVPIYSYFNGLGGSNYFFHTVYNQIQELELHDLGFEVEFRKMNVDIKKEAWDGVERAYFQFKEYLLPICRREIRE